MSKGTIPPSLLFLVGFLGLAASSAQAKTRVVDLTQELSEEIPVFPGGAPFRKSRAADFHRDGYFAQRLQMGEHTGTHVDAPIHFDEGALDISEIPPDRLLGPGVKVSFWKKVLEDPDAAVTSTDLRDWEKIYGKIPEWAVVLIETGWERRWPSQTDYPNVDRHGRLRFPGLSEEAALLLVERGVTAVGIDTLSIDPGLSTEFKAHKVLAKARILVIENLTNLRLLPERGYTVVVAPLKIEGGSGAPARVLAFLDEELLGIRR